MKKLYLLLFLILSMLGFSQTPGLIIRDGANNIPPLTKSTVLDPNQDGYVSTTNTGFTTTDLGLASEIPYVGTSLIFPETSGDLQRGPSGGFSDLVPDVNGKSFYTYYSSSASALLFRIRIGDIVAGAKAYSVMIDADGLFGTADPTYKATNPGFEYEVVVQTGFKIAVYNVDNGTTCTSVWERDLQTNSQYYQTAIALSNNGGNPDYFIDFYVPLSSFTGSSVITSTTPLRYQVGTVMAPKPSLCGPVSDSYPPENVATQPTCTPEQLANGTCQTQPCTPAPVVNTITTGDTAVTGTWTKATYSADNTAIIYIYKNGSLLGTTTANSGGTWSYTTSALSSGDVVYATAKSTNGSICNTSNKITASSCTVATLTPCPTTESICFSSKGFVGSGYTTTNLPAGTIVRIYKASATGNTMVYEYTVINAGLDWGWNGTVGSTINAGSNACNSGSTDVADGSYFITYTYPSKCESNCGSIYSVGACSVSPAPPTVSTTPIYTNSTILSGTTFASSTVLLYYDNDPSVGGINLTQLATTTSSSTGAFSFNLTNYNLQAGYEFRVRVISGGCLSASTVVPIVCSVTSPSINHNGSDFITAGTAIAGKSTEIGGTITVYNGSGTQIGTTTVLSNGTWTLSSPTAIAGTSYYATVTTTCATSGKSNTVTGMTGTSATRCGTITSPISDTVTSVSGTLGSAVSGTIVTLYIDGFPIGNVSTNTTTWSIPVNTSITNVIYAGGVLTIGITETNKTEVICSASTTVACTKPSSVTLDSTIYYASTGSNANISVTNSQTGVLYTVEDLTGKDFSSSYFGNGTSSLSMITFPIDFSGTKTFVVKAFNVNSSICTASTTFTISTVCYKPLHTTGATLDTNHGITALARAGEDNSNWPMARKGAWTVLEAKTKGFVVNRLTDAQVSAIPSADLREGMMVYNITQDCLQINIDGTATGWRCFNTQTCPDL